MDRMALLEYGRLTHAWKGEASDFTPLLAEQLDQIGAAIGVDLASMGQSEVLTTGGRRIDIVAESSDGSEFVVDDQYGRADHDHMTRGLAYAVARRARGLVNVAEEHRDEVRAVAEYLNNLAELDPHRGISGWLVEARAVRIGTSPWAPLFTAIIEPNVVTANVEQAKQAEGPVSFPEFWSQFKSEPTRQAVERFVEQWQKAGYRCRLAHNHVVLAAAGPSTSKVRTIVALYSDGHVMVPFGAYHGQNSGIGIDPLMTGEFRARADKLFGFNGSERMAHTPAGWITAERSTDLMAFCIEVAKAYAEAMPSLPSSTLVI